MGMEGDVLTVERVIPAPPKAIFDLLADASAHTRFDGSGSVRQVRGSSPQRLELGSVFGMSMKIGVPYAMANTVTEFEQDRRIAWRHLGRHVWRWELAPVPEGTRVTETFDWSGALSPRALELAGIPARNARSIDRTLPRLKALAER